MKTTILNKLRQIEKDENIEILFAVESGSRAWGFPSTDSDYDIRLIYRRKISDYLRIEPIDDFIDFKIVDELDFKAWDIQKVLRLILKSNSSIVEYLQSPIHYITNKEFEKSLLAIVKSQFNPRKVSMHYLGITTRKLIEIEGNKELKLKHLFYALRSVLSAKWVIEKETIPPMEFKKLAHLIDDNFLLDKIENYLKIKANVDESYLIVKDEELLNWISELKTELKAKAELISKIEFDKELINDFFLDTIRNEN
ncbi:nucleotidyltransferase domain-containing protein [Chishuiella sp.]|uniref:nucleotidyltransferase domain-containing protein n=1 Tax=Chishuiella sp. TaxID=1969467 RepID=UPI0028AC60B7|nr:nucleotidyltransferase domain-containing protein [Chishuiella sp.]